MGDCLKLLDLVAPQFEQPSGNSTGLWDFMRMTGAGAALYVFVFATGGHRHLHALFRLAPAVALRETFCLAVLYTRFLGGMILLMVSTDALNDSAVARTERSLWYTERTSVGSKSSTRVLWRRARRYGLRESLEQRRMRR